MSLKTQLRYFFFVTKNWGIRLGLFTLVTEVRGERKYKIHTTDHRELKDLEISSDEKKYGHIYQPTNYFVLEKALSFLREQDLKGNFTDFGCGSGRILCVAAFFGFDNLTGVDFAPGLCRRAEENLKQVALRFSSLHYKIRCTDAGAYTIQDDDSIFSFFNPFGRRIMISVVRNMMNSVNKTPRTVYVVYFNPMEKDIFLSAGFHELWYYSKLDYIDFSILVKAPDEDAS